MICKNCGSTQPDDAKFCSNCGSTIETENNINTVKTTESQPVEEQVENNQPSNEQNSESTDQLEKEQPVFDTVENQKEKTALDGTKGKIKSFWNNLDLFNKIETVGAIFVCIFLFAALCRGKVFPIIISVLQLGGLLVAFLIHRGNIKCNLNWLKYAVLAVAIIFSGLYFSSYKWLDMPNISIFDTSKSDTPYSAQVCVGKDKDVVEIDFSAAGFNNIEQEPIEDLELFEADEYGKVETVSINGVSDFKGNKEFKSNSRVVIKYHAFKKIAVPLSSEEIKSMDTESVLNEFEKSGFFQLSTDEKYDIDPDENKVDFENIISIDGTDSFEKGAKFSPNADISLVTHRPYQKYSLKVIIDFVPNLFFSKYDVKFEIGDHSEKLTHGNDAEFEYRLKQGDYTLTFTSTESRSVKGTIDLKLNGDVEACYKISCTSEKVNIETQYVENKGIVGENQAMVPSSSSNCKYKNYKNIKKAFKNAGFTNIKEKILYDIYWGFTDEGEVASVTIDGKASFKRGDVFAKDVEVIITYHMKEEDDPSKRQETTSNSTVTTESKETISSNNTIPMPVMNGSSLDSVVSVANKYGLSAQFSDEDWGNRTKMRGMSSSGLSINIVYSSSTKELLLVNIVTFTTLSTTQEQKDFIKEIAKVACPLSDSSAVSSWVNNNIGKTNETKINNVTYELFTGPTGNLCYNAGNAEWEAWDIATH